MIVISGEKKKDLIIYVLFYKTEGYVIMGFCRKFASGTLRINLLLGLRIEQFQNN